jgi:hypothetical protein
MVGYPGNIPAYSGHVPVVSQPEVVDFPRIPPKRCVFVFLPFFPDQNVLWVFVADRGGLGGQVSQYAVGICERAAG